jgi:hypothetical protein
MTGGHSFVSRGARERKPRGDIAGQPISLRKLRESLQDGWEIKKVSFYARKILHTAGKCIDLKNEELKTLLRSWSLTFYRSRVLRVRKFI